MRAGGSIVAEPDLIEAPPQHIRQVTFWLRRKAQSPKLKAVRPIRFRIAPRQTIMPLVMPDPRRIQRLEQLILQTLGPTIAQLDDPRMGLVTVTRIRLSRDLSVARVNWSCVGDEGERNRSEHALEHACGYLQSIVAGAMHTRVTPRLEFHHDASMENAARISGILHKLAEERGEHEEPEESEEPEETAEEESGEQSPPE